MLAAAVMTLENAVSTNGLAVISADKSGTVKTTGLPVGSKYALLSVPIPYRRKVIVMGIGEFGSAGND